MSTISKKSGSSRPARDSKHVKIFITGDSGGGKSTTAVALGKHLKIPVFHSDLYRFKEAGILNPYPEFKKTIESIIKTNEKYIIEGIEFGDDQILFEKLMNEADIVLNFEVPPRVSITSFFNRYFDYFEKGTPHIGINIGSSYKASSEHFKCFIDFYYSYQSRRHLRQPILKKCSKKVVNIHNFKEADQVIANFAIAEINLVRNDPSLLLSSDTF